MKRSLNVDDKTPIYGSDLADLRFGLRPRLPGSLAPGILTAANAKEAIATWIASAEAHGEPIPEATVRPQAIVVQIAA